jgi:hypothetical protein
MGLWACLLLVLCLNNAGAVRIDVGVYGEMLELAGGPTIENLEILQKAGGVIEQVSDLKDVSCDVGKCRGGKCRFKDCKVKKQAYSRYYRATLVLFHSIEKRHILGGGNV